VASDFIMLDLKQTDINIHLSTEKLCRGKSTLVWLATLGTG